MFRVQIRFLVGLHRETTSKPPVDNSLFFNICKNGMLDKEQKIGLFFGTKIDVNPVAMAFLG